MSHQRANSVSGSFNHQYKGDMVSTAMPPMSPTSSFNNSTSAASVSTPLSISIPRQRSFSTSISRAATSPRAFTGSSIIANPNYGFLSSSVGTATTPFSAAAFGAPLASPTSVSSPSGASSTTIPSSQSVPVLHRRFSTSFNQLNQFVGSPTTTNGGVNSQTSERGRRASSFFGSGSPPTSINDITNSSATNTGTSSGSGAGGLFRKFSTTGRSAGHPFDRNDAGPTNLGGLQSNKSGHHIHGEQSMFAHAPDHDVKTIAVDSYAGSIHKNADSHLKPSCQDKHSRSSSPMRSMILNGQMLD
ncbi:hypothetical protein BX616_003949 [Lobosporangium transversale]|uniref:Uncharacterized protein n=1 Tax=Lobosporangium transversale TaxID=64571 RepID=A0A1Y2GNQ8_9FUNG|nr:hypothetical protein BCR41DRAFT_421926 [Lobosporangium transversale]KAF9916363.1 hypothetical protein BX616_003949 [Lobosporangium transversale]ORZ16750.1 hypothetical protein BCR41DRAFT_421926 [Lobosporangium transversale]|eukprot:XP_021881685.1 hypothetical protein BCR41DRAFT_421926 [Lobosporangium transversale]